MYERGKIVSLFREEFVVMKKILVVLMCSVLFACSSTTSDVHQLKGPLDNTSTNGLKLEVAGDDIQLTFQTDSRIFSLHQNADDVTRVTELVAERYGFNIVEAGAEEYSLELISVVPDGGDCVTGFSSVMNNLSYTGSILTFGLLPATSEHCLVVTADLYQIESGERVLVGRFSSDLGRIDVYAGANEVDNYQLTVDRRDEIRSLEVSVGGLLNLMISEYSFE